MRSLISAVLVLISTTEAVAESEQRIDDCEQAHDTAYDQRLCIERGISEEAFVLIPYRPNYFIGSIANGVAEENVLNNSEYDDFETKFQLSFKKPVTSYREPRRCLWIDDTQCTLFFAYTQVSVWQMLNFDQSAPFLDTNFEPELFVTQLMDRALPFDWRLRQVNYGLISHQSNGKSPPESRSWNRSYIDTLFQREKNYLSLKFWQRWNEDSKNDPADFEGDDNPDIEDYVGNMELRYFYADDFNNYSLVLRDSSRNPNRVNYEISWSYPLSRRSRFRESDLRLYVQYYNGFGETLIDYNIKRERFGIGVMLTDWL